MTVNLTTTNVLLGILATVSVLETLAVIALCGGIIMLIRRLTTALEGIEERRVAPAATRVNDILDDVKAMTDVARRAAERADRVAGWWKVFRPAQH